MTISPRKVFDATLRLKREQTREIVDASCLNVTYQTFVTNLLLVGVELRCKLQEKLHRVTGPLKVAPYFVHGCRTLINFV